MNFMLYLGLNKQISRTYHFALEQSMAEIKNNFTRKCCFDVWNMVKEHRFSFKKKDGSDIFCFVSGGKQRSQSSVM